jgi:hypothetical protein
MPPQTIERRVERLEEQVTSLQQLPARMDALSVQISQLREDLGMQISAVEKRLVATEDRILVQVRMLHEDVIARLALIQEGRPHSRRSPGGGRLKG